MTETLRRVSVVEHYYALTLALARLSCFVYKPIVILFKQFTLRINKKSALCHLYKLTLKRQTARCLKELSDTVLDPLRRRRQPPRRIFRHGRAAAEFFLWLSRIPEEFFKRSSQPNIFRRKFGANIQRSRNETDSVLYLYFLLFLFVPVYHFVLHLCD